MSTLKKMGRTNSRWHNPNRISKVVRYPEQERNRILEIRLSNTPPEFGRGARVRFSKRNADIDAVRERILHPEWYQVRRVA